MRDFTDKYPMRMGTLLLMVLLSGCSLDASLMTPRSLTDNLPDPGDSGPNLKPQRVDADFIAGEVVTTGNGVVIQGTFGEISEKKELSNGVTFEGAFYE